jgi:hypothetical protein
MVSRSQIDCGGARGTPTRAVAGGGPRPGGRSNARAKITEADGAGSTGVGVRTTLGSDRVMLIGQIAGACCRWLWLGFPP